MLFQHNTPKTREQRKTLEHVTEQIKTTKDEKAKDTLQNMATLLQLRLARYMHPSKEYGQFLSY